MLISKFVDQIEKAACNGGKAHLSADVLRAVISDPAWMGYLASRQKEIVSQWEEEQPPAAPSSAPSGSGIAPSEMSGASAGTMTPELTAEVGLAASRQAFKAVDLIRRRGKPSAP